jgi:hypothetical protein
MGTRRSALARESGHHRPGSNEWRYYRLAVWPDLFGRALLARQWGRIGTQGHVRLDPHPDAGAAINALARLVPPVLDLAVNFRIDGSATTEMHRDRETKCREEVRSAAER